MRALLQRLSAPPAQTLQTVKPTPFTVSYTVSTRPVPRTVAAKIAGYGGLLVRILAGLSTALFVGIAARIAPGQITLDLLYYVLGHQGTWQVLGYADTCPWKYMVPCAFVVFFLVFRRNYTGIATCNCICCECRSNNYVEESLTVLRGLGVQTSTTSSTYLQTPTTRFIPTTSIQDIFVYEAFKGFEVRFYLAIVVQGEADVVVVYPSLLPHRAILEEVWRGTRKCLWEGKEEARSRRDDDNDHSKEKAESKS
jgi:phosphatidylinositol glycan class H protein